MTNYRKTTLYKKLTAYQACEIAEGFDESKKYSKDQQLTAWQYIYDRSIWKHLQGWYGRTVTDLLENGLIRA